MQTTHSAKQHNGILNGLWALYILTLSAPVLQTNYQAIVHHKPAVWLGILLLVVMLAEVWVLPKKLQNIAPIINAAHPETQKTLQSAVFVLWMFHTVISVILLMNIFALLGYHLTQPHAEPTWWIVALFFVVVIKELFLLFTLLFLTDEKENSPPPTAPPTTLNWVYDVVLLVYACLVYTATWQTISYGMAGKSSGNMAMLAVNMFASALLFIIFYLPIRIPYVLEELTESSANSSSWRYALGGYIVLIACMWYEMFG